jgi:hypothetical protein
VELFDLYTSDGYNSPHFKDGGKAMKILIKPLTALLAVVILGACPASAKKDKGGGPSIPPVITAEQAKATVTAALPQLSQGKPYSKHLPFAFLTHPGRADLQLRQNGLYRFGGFLRRDRKPRGLDLLPLGQYFPG